MEPNRVNRLVNLIMYNGSADERNQHFYDKAGYIGYLFLVFGIAVEAAIKLNIAKVGIEQILPELCLLLASLVVVTTFLFHFRITGFENLRQRRAIGITFTVIAVAISLGGYTGMVLNMPQALWLINLGVLGWILPAAIGISSGLLFWLLVNLLGSHLNRRASHGTDQ